MQNLLRICCWLMLCAATNLAQTAYALTPEEEELKRQQEEIAAQERQGITTSPAGSGNENVTIAVPEDRFHEEVVKPVQREAAIKKAAENTLISEIAEIARKLKIENASGMSSKDRPKLEQDLASKKDQLAVMQNKSFGSKGDQASVKRQIAETATNTRNSSDAHREAMDKIKANPVDYVDAFKAMTLAATGKPDEMKTITATVQKMLNTATDGGMVKGIRSLASDSGVTIDQSQAAQGFVTQIIHALNDKDGVRARGPLSAASELDSRLSAPVMESAKQVIRDNLSTAASIAEANAVYTAARDAGIENYESVDVSSRKEAVLNAARNGDQVQIKGLVDDASASGRRIVVMAAVDNQMNLDRDAILAPSSSGTPGVKLKALVQANEAFHSATGTTSEALSFRKDTANKLEGKIDNMISNPRSADLNEAKDVRNMLNAIAAYGEVISNVIPKVEAQVAQIQAAATSGDPNKIDRANEDRAALVPILREFISKGTTTLVDELERINLNTTPRPAPVPTTAPSIPPTTSPTTPPAPIVPPSTTPPATALAPKVQIPPAVVLPGAARRNIVKRSELIEKRPSTRRSPRPTTGKGKNGPKTQVEGQKRYKVTRDEEKVKQ